MSRMTRFKEFTLPDLGEGLTEGEILSWLVEVGDTITLNQPIVEVETAKAAVEIPAKWAGVVTRIFHEAGTVVEVGAPIITIDTDPSAGPLPSAESLAAVEIAPAEGAIEPGMIGGPAPGGRTATSTRPPSRPPPSCPPSFRDVGVSTKIARATSGKSGIESGRDTPTSLKLRTRYPNFREVGPAVSRTSGSTSWPRARPAIRSAPPVAGATMRARRP